MNPSEPYAVMVFFHGGAFQAGANIQYTGHFLAARDVIVVVPNYRLGIFGKINLIDANHKHFYLGILSCVTNNVNSKNNTDENI